MKKTAILLIISFVVLFVFPLLTVLYAATNGMMICFLLFFAVNPLFFIVEGIVCGFSLRKHWCLPLISALVYLFSTWILLDMGETAFLLYTGIYLGGSLVSMLGAYFGMKFGQRNKK